MASIYQQDIGSRTNIRVGNDQKLSIFNRKQLAFLDNSSKKPIVLGDASRYTITCAKIKIVSQDMLGHEEEMKIE